MKTLILVLMLSTMAYGVDSVTAFAGIPYGSSTTFVEATLTENGFTRDSRGEAVVRSTPGFRQTDAVYEGSILSHKARIVVFFDDNGGAVKFAIMFRGLDHKVIKVFDEFRAAYKEKYGKPNRDCKLFGQPFSEGDGYELTAIQTGKAVFACIWDYEGSGGISIGIDSGLTLTIAYESTMWSDEVDRRQKPSKDLL